MKTSRGRFKSIHEEAGQWHSLPRKISGKGLRRFTTRRGSEAVAHGVFRDDARSEELQQVIWSTRFRTDAAEFKPAEGLPIDQGSGDFAVDVQIAHAKFAPDPGDVGWTPREESASQGVGRAISDGKSLA